MMNFRFPLALFLSIGVTSTQAVDVEYSNQSKRQSTDQDQVETAETAARRFGLTSTDWARYEEVMKGEGRYHWSHLDPVWVLAIDAQSDAERDRYASLAAEQEYERNRKLFLFKDAYVEAFQSKYAHIPIMDLQALEEKFKKRQMKASIDGPGQSLLDIAQPINTEGDRMVLFMATNGCPACDGAFMKLMQQQTPGVTLDLHFIGDTKSNITTWAKRMGIDPADIKEGRITLNNKTDMYAQYGSPNLPAAYYYDASNEQVLSISEVGSQ
jgi:integrating conjugative element protein (TIGR03759 family)